MIGWLWDCLMLIKDDLGQLPIDTFATDQPTDPFALTRYNDRTFGTRARPIGKADSVSSDRRFPEFRGGGETCGVHYITRERGSTDLTIRPTLVGFGCGAAGRLMEYII